MEKLNLREHIDYVIQCTKELGLSQSTVGHYIRHYEAVFLYCTKNGIDALTFQDAADFCKLKYGTNPQKSMAKDARKAAYTVARYFETGKFSWDAITFVTRDPVSAGYKKLMAVFKQELSKKPSPRTVRPEMIIIRQFLYFLEQAGVLDAPSITSENVLDFVRQEAVNHKGSMPRLLQTMRNFMCFLRRQGIADLDADRFPGTAGRCRQKALPCFTDNELQTVFSQIDRTTDKGRRDYAVFLLAVRTGLRACDISKLKLADIFWAEKTIRIVQKKTKVSLLLPLPVDVGNAIADYALVSKGIHGHVRFEDTLYYIHILPERLVSSQGVHWDVIDSIGLEDGIWEH